MNDVLGTRFTGGVLIALVSLGAPTWVALEALRIADSPRQADVAANSSSSTGQAAPATAAAPATLAETGLYADAATRRIAEGVLDFAPQYPLWTDGASKSRWIRLPAGTAIDASDVDAWRFPVGTKLWKEFAFERPVETRYMELGADGRWLYATYVWSEDGREARLAPERGLRGAHALAGGARHDIPGRMDCLACHEASSNSVLGFSALQLSADRDPLAPHGAGARDSITLDQLVARGLVRNLPPEHLEQPPRIGARSPRERAALGYLHANCGGCHASEGVLAPLGLDLRYSLGRGSAAVSTALEVPSQFRSASTGELRIAPGAPDQSVLFQRASTRNPFVQMPALGTHAVDDEAVALLRDWIAIDLARAETSPDSDSRVAQR